MKTTALFAFIFLSISILETNAQLKVSHFGGVGLGIEPRADYKLVMKGGLLLTTYPEIPPPLTRYTEFRIKLGNGWPGCEFGTPTRGIAVWSTEVGYNDLYARHIYRSSDTTLKTEIAPLLNSLDKIKLIKSYSYKMKYDSIIDNRLSYGFLAQEIVGILPDIVDSAKGTLLIDYDQIIPYIVGAINEQQYSIDSLRNISQGSGSRKSNIDSSFNITIDSLINEINDMKELISECCNSRKIKNSEINSYSKLYQNKPNPFSEKTLIEFEIRNKERSSSIMIFDMQGTLKKTIDIYESGSGQVMINGFELSPGMYLYSLIVDDKEVDTKRMIIVN